MQNQFALWLAVMFGFTSCAEDADDSNGGREPDLVGTWMEVRTTQSGNDWLSTERSTVIIERDGDQLRFRNCLDDASVTATAQNKTVIVNSTRYPELQLSDDDTLTAVTTVNNTEVALYRLDTTTSPVLADLSLQQPGDLDTWTQLCLETRVSDDDGYRLAFKASNSLMDIMVAMNFESETPFESAQFEYPDVQRPVTGQYALPGGDTGSLSDPDGTLVISESGTRDFQANIFMDSSHGGTIEIDALLNIEQQWFDSE